MTPPTTTLATLSPLSNWQRPADGGSSNHTSTTSPMTLPTLAPPQPTQLERTLPLPNPQSYSISQPGSINSHLVPTYDAFSLLHVEAANSACGSCPWDSASHVSSHNALLKPSPISHFPPASPLTSTLTTSVSADHAHCCPPSPQNFAAAHHTWAPFSTNPTTRRQQITISLASTIHICIAHDVSPKKPSISYTSYTRSWLTPYIPQFSRVPFGPSPPFSDYYSSRLEFSTSTCHYIFAQSLSCVPLPLQPPIPDGIPQLKLIPQHTRIYCHGLPRHSRTHRSPWSPFPPTSPTPSYATLPPPVGEPFTFAV